MDPRGLHPKEMCLATCLSYLEILSGTNERHGRRAREGKSKHDTEWGKGRERGRKGERRRKGRSGKEKKRRLRGERD